MILIAQAFFQWTLRSHCWLWRFEWKCFKSHPTTASSWSAQSFTTHSLVKAWCCSLTILWYFWLIVPLLKWFQLLQLQFLCSPVVVAAIIIDIGIYLDSASLFNWISCPATAEFQLSWQWKLATYFLVAASFSKLLFGFSRIIESPTFLVANATRRVSFTLIFIRQEFQHGRRRWKYWRSVLLPNSS